jgi:hypothetical protein
MRRYRGARRAQCRHGTGHYRRQHIDAKFRSDWVPLMALARGAQWVRRVALPQVPEEFRDSFLQRNPSNRALLAAADRRLAH